MLASFLEGPTRPDTRSSAAGAMRSRRSRFLPSTVETGSPADGQVGRSPATTCRAEPHVIHVGKPSAKSSALSPFRVQVQDSAARAPFSCSNKRTRRPVSAADLASDNAIVVHRRCARSVRTEPLVGADCARRAFAALRTGSFGVLEQVRRRALSMPSIQRAHADSTNRRHSSPRARSSRFARRICRRAASDW